MDGCSLYLEYLTGYVSDLGRNYPDPDRRMQQSFSCRISWSLTPQCWWQKRVVILVTARTEPEQTEDRHLLVGDLLGYSLCFVLWSWLFLLYNDDAASELRNAWFESPLPVIFEDLRIIEARFKKKNTAQEQNGNVSYTSWPLKPCRGYQRFKDTLKFSRIKLSNPWLKKVYPVQSLQ